MSHPILYSFRRCPYAMRARMALRYSAINVELREVVLRDKPQAMLDISPKGTVPVLQLEDGRVIDESLDIMHWALDQNDPAQWRPPALRPDINSLISNCDNSFKPSLDRYKYHERYPEKSQFEYRQEGEVFLQYLNTQLSEQQFLLGDHPTVADIAIMPFIRQFAHVDRIWFQASTYSHLIEWLTYWRNNPAFVSIMQKYTAWKPDDKPVFLLTSDIKNGVQTSDK